MEVLIISFRMLRKKLWPTDYEKVMHTVKRKPIANHLFHDSFTMSDSLKNRDRYNKNGQ